MKVTSLAIVSFAALARAQSLGDAIDDVSEGIDNVGDDIGDGFDTVSSAVDGAFDDVSTRVGDAFESVQTFASGIGEDGESLINEVTSRVGDAISDLPQITEAPNLSSLSDFFEDQLSEFTEFLTDPALSSIFDEIQSMTQLTDIDAIISQIPSEYMSDIGAIVSQVPSEWRSLIPSEITEAAGGVVSTTESPDAAPYQTAAVAMGALFGGAALVANM